MAELIINENEIHQAIWKWLFEGNNGISQLSFILAQYDNDGNIVNGSEIIYVPETIGNSTELATYIDGTTYNVYNFIIQQYAPLTTTSNTAYNVVVLQAFENVVNWIKEQYENDTLPEFPDGCTIEKLIVNPGTIAGVDAKGAKFQLLLQIEYEKNGK